MERSRVKTLLQSNSFGETVLLKGWVRTRRDSKGGFSFLEINDGSSLKGIQVIAGDSLSNYEADVLRTTTGASVEVTGVLKESPAKGQSVEIEATEFKLVGTSDGETYPLQKKRHSMEFLREIAHLRPRSNTFGAVTRVRNRLAFAVHEYFQKHGFQYINTPIITANDCEGAGEMFTVSTLDPEKLPKTQDGAVDFSQDFFGKRASLTVSGQLAVENYCMALDRVYTFGPTFRAENSNTARHLAEFWMIEPEMAFCDLEGDMDLAEDFIKHLFKVALAECAEDLEFFNQWIDKELITTLKHIVESDFVRISYTEAVEQLMNSGEKFEYPVEWGKDLQSEHERFLTEVTYKKPVIVYNYPKQIKAFYMRVNDDGKTVAAMDVLVPRTGEIIGGSQREERYDVLEARMKECGLDPKEYWWYLDLRKYGSVPHAGFGLGFERLVQFVTGMGNIRDAIPFPRVPGNCEF